MSKRPADPRFERSAKRALRAYLVIGLTTVPGPTLLFFGAVGGHRALTIVGGVLTGVFFLKVVFDPFLFAWLDRGERRSRSTRR